MHAPAYEDAPGQAITTGNDKKAMPKKNEGGKNDPGERHKGPYSLGTLWAQGHYSSVIIEAYEDARD